MKNRLTIHEPDLYAGKITDLFVLDTAKRILNIYDYVWCFVVF